MERVESPRMDDAGLEPVLAARSTAPRVTLDDIHGAIVSDEYIVRGTLTICVLTLRNGFQVIGESAAASPENFDEEIGRKLAFAKARDKLWPLLGYALKERLAQPPKPPRDFKQRVRDEKAELDERLGRLRAFFNLPMFATVDADEQVRLHKQAVAMKLYSDILGERIAVWGG